MILKVAPKPLALALFLCSAALIGAFWHWLGTPVVMPPSPVAESGRLNCMSYAPYRQRQSPLTKGVVLDVADIEDDLTRLAKVTDCIRTYSAIPRGEEIAAIAERHGLKLLQGIWLSREPAGNAAEIDAALAIAARRPGTLRALIVGNEVLLRGDLTATDLAAAIKTVKQRATIPVTYADVWEFWIRNANIAENTDFVTIHILPYWEDMPVAAGAAAAHVSAIYAKVRAAFPGKDLLVGEVGWPSTGRMREAALPSPSQQARVIHDVLEFARRDNIKVNIIESFDQPWKRALEGTVGGHWGILDADTRVPKFAWGLPVSDHPLWAWQAGIGIALSLITFAAALAASSPGTPFTVKWCIATFVIATVSGALIGWTLETIQRESFGPLGWTRSIVLALLAVVVPPLAAALIPRGPPPSFASVLNGWNQSSQGLLPFAAGATLILTFLAASEIALGLVFDPRYRDFPYASLTAIATAFAALAVFNRQPGRPGLAELFGAGLLALSAGYVALNEGFANWQSLWACAAVLLLAWTLTRAPAAQS